MTKIQGYQINLDSISGYIQQVATGTGVGGNYYPSNSNPSGYITPSQTGQFYSSNNPSGFITSGGTSIPASPATYFGYTGFLITGNGIWSGNLLSGQGVLTTRIAASTGNYTGTLIIGNTNAFAGSLARYNFQFPIGLGIVIIVSGLNNSQIITQSGFTTSGNVYMEWSFDGNRWNNDLWI